MPATGQVPPPLQPSVSLSAGWEGWAASQERASRAPVSLPPCHPATLLRKQLVMSPGLRVPCQGLPWSVPLWLCPAFRRPLCPFCLLPLPCLALALCLLGWGPRALSLRSPPGLDPCLWDPLTSPIAGQEEGGPTVSLEPHAAKSRVHCEGPGCLLRGWRRPCTQHSPAHFSDHSAAFTECVLHARRVQRTAMAMLGRAGSLWLPWGHQLGDHHEKAPVAWRSGGGPRCWQGWRGVRVEVGCLGSVLEGEDSVPSVAWAVADGCVKGHLSWLLG